MASREIDTLAGFYVFGEVTVDGDAWIEEKVDDGDDGDDDDGAGCQSCSSSLVSGPTPAGLLALLLGLVALRRRRS